jgi:hypothetical protein
MMMNKYILGIGYFILSPLKVNSVIGNEKFRQVLPSLRVFYSVRNEQREQEKEWAGEGVKEWAEEMEEWPGMVSMERVDEGWWNEQGGWRNMLEGKNWKGEQEGGKSGGRGGGMGWGKGIEGQGWAGGMCKGKGAEEWGREGWRNEQGGG